MGPLFFSILISCFLLVEVKSDDNAPPQLALQVGHDGKISAFATSNDDKLLATGSSDSTIILWDLATGRELYPVSGGGGRIVALSFSEDSRFLAAGSSLHSGTENRIVIWDLSLKPPSPLIIYEGSKKKGQYLIPAIFKPIALAFSPDDKALVYSGRLLGMGDLHVWDMQEKKERYATTSRFGYASALAVARGNGAIATGWDTGAVTIPWGSPPKSKEIGKFDTAVTELSFNHDGTSLLASDGKTVKLWKLTSPIEACTVAGARASFKGDSLVVVNSDHISHFYGFAEPGSVCSQVAAPVEGPGPEWSAFLDDDQLKIFNTKDGSFRWSPVGNLVSTGDVTFDRQSGLLATATRAGTRIFDVITGEPDFVSDPADSARFSPSKRLLATQLTSSSSGIQIWDTVARRRERVLPSSSGLVSSRLSFSASGHFIATPNEDQVRIIDVSGSGATIPIYIPQARSIAFNPRNELELFVADFVSGIHMTRGKSDSLLPGPRVSANALALDSSGQFLAAASADGGVYLWRVEDRKALGPLTKSASSAQSVAFNPQDPGIIASGNQDGTILLDTPNEIYSLLGHTGAVVSLTFSSDGRLLISGSLDGTTRVWDVQNRKEVLEILSFSTSKDWLVVTPGGLFDGSAAAMRQVGWRLDNGNDVVPLEAFYNDYFHPGVLAEIFESKNPEPPYDLATRLRFPALRTMAQQGLASIQKRDGKILLCLSRKASPSSVKGLGVKGRGADLDVGTEGFKEAPEDDVCTYSKELPSDRGPYELEGTTTGWKSKLTDSKVSDGHNTDVSKSTLHVFTVGVDKYRDAYSPLYFPVADADAIESFFQKQKEARKPFADVNIRKGLRDETATRQGIRDELSAMAKEVKEDDVVFLFFSGHGRVPPGQEMFYYIPYLPPAPDNPSVVDPIEEREAGLSTAMLAEAIRNLAARRVVLVVDACQSGGAVESLAKIGEVKWAVEERRANQEKAGNRSGHDHDVGVYILAAATPVQDALEPFPDMVKGNKNNSLLTTALLEALNSKDPTGNSTIWITTVFQQVKENLRELAANYNSVQTAFPVMVGSADFPVAVK